MSLSTRKPSAWHLPRRHSANGRHRDGRAAVAPELGSALHRQPAARLLPALRGYDINRYHAFRPDCPLDNPNYPNITTGVTSCETADLATGFPGGAYDLRLGNPVPEAKNIRQPRMRAHQLVRLKLSRAVRGFFGG